MKLRNDVWKGLLSGRALLSVFMSVVWACSLAVLVLVWLVLLTEHPFGRSAAGEPNQVGGPELTFARSAGLQTVTVTPTPACVPAWRMTASANTLWAADTLRGIAASSAGDTWAVGYYREPLSGSLQTLIERWDGTQWALVQSPNRSAADNQLYAVAVVSPTVVWAVGSYSMTVGGPRQTLIERWDGTEWSVIPSPNRGTGNNHLYGISASSATDVWAVGDYTDTNGRSQTLILHWDGSAWNVADSPSLPYDNVLYAVTAVSTTDVWAVGCSMAGLGPITHILHWDGSTWSKSESLFPGILYGVAAISANDAWAVGTYATDTVPPVTLALHWDGSSWRIVRSPSPGEVAFLHGVVKLSSGEVWAVGYYRERSPQPAERSLVERWNGAEWILVEARDAYPEYYGNRLYGVTAVSATDTWAAGYFSYNLNTEAGYTLIEHGGRFSDVVPTDYFFPGVDYLAAHGVISGYADCTFQPYNNSTRAQLTKIAVLGFGLPLHAPPQPTFTDVPATHTFYQYIETAASEGIVSGYADGTFRPGNDVTRGQLSKIVVVAAAWPLVDPPAPTFTDVPTNHTFYTYIETASDHEIISGYADGTFRPGSNATRGQISKIVYNAVIQP